MKKDFEFVNRFAFAGFGFLAGYRAYLMRLVKTKQNLMSMYQQAAHFRTHEIGSRLLQRHMLHRIQYFCE